MALYVRKCGRRTRFAGGRLAVGRKRNLAAEGDRRAPKDQRGHRTAAGGLAKPQVTSYVFWTMVQINQTIVTEFLLLGFGDLHHFRILLFIVFLIIHILALVSNILVIVLIVVMQSLHSAMYFFLSQLSLSELIFTSNIVPTMLWLVLVGGGKISISRCIVQLYLLAVPAISQCLLLASMSFDRYVAICRPLHYATIMTFSRQVLIVTICWVVGFMVSFVLYLLLDRLEFCGTNTINHFYCDIPPVVELTCAKNRSAELVISMLCFPFLACPCLFIMATYISIIHAIQKITSTSGRQKAFSTCSSHLTVVGLYYGSLGSTYVFPPDKSSFNVNKGLSLLFTLVTPLINPLIYSLRNQEMRTAINKLIHL
ncbi:olfactory receptor 2D2-like [Hyperolius riggenbachi]|uniref:olfactory receptor 2D2-like n=1 Tax=Hyperolius riggenbachi TaxID=752182 RepID=UPI0035A289F6